MLFNSIAFLVFLPIVFILYWSPIRRSLRSQNALLLAASYLFYGWWDYRFLSLIVISSLVDYMIARRLDGEEASGQRRLLVTLSLLINLGLLGVFKYYGFFVDSMTDLLSSIGFKPNLGSLNIILPVGISFYTFQTLSYTLDVYHRKINATRDLIAFFTFVSFFPQLVAGPIERARQLLPQFLKHRQFDLHAAKDGLRQMFWGMFKKVVIADNVADHVQSIYTDYATMDSATLFIGTFLFAVQIYCDFSGYSDIAIGCARLFGIRLMRNFAFPYFARSIGEFWQRWHISLSTWFRDYLYIPLGGNRTSRARHVSNVVITFMVSGFWHGANWTFVVWGILHALYSLPSMLFARRNKGAQTAIVAEGRLLPRAGELVRMTTTFLLVCFAWVFFRATSLSHALSYIDRFVRGPYWTGHALGHYKKAVALSVALLLIEWFQRDKQHALDVRQLHVVTRWSLYVLVTMALLALGNFGEVDFIYFQF